jgi:hypothetical protein
MDFANQELQKEQQKVLGDVAGWVRAVGNLDQISNIPQNHSRNHPNPNAFTF